MHGDTLNNQQAWVLIFNQENMRVEVTNFADVKFVFRPLDASNEKALE